MTESEIMKALECHINDITTCGECPLKRDLGCSHTLSKSALDLINRKNAEKDELQHEKAKLQHKIEELNFENLQLVASFRDLKAEAIKEFAERVKEYIYESDDINHKFEPEILRISFRRVFNVSRGFLIKFLFQVYPVHPRFAPAWP